MDRQAVTATKFYLVVGRIQGTQTSKTAYFKATKQSRKEAWYGK